MLGAPLGLYAFVIVAAFVSGTYAGGIGAEVNQDKSRALGICALVVWGSLIHTASSSAAVAVRQHVECRRSAAGLTTDAHERAQLCYNPLQ